MNRQELREHVRFLLNEPTAGFYNDTDLNRLINIAQYKVAQTITNIKEDTFVVSATFSTEANKKSYALPTDFQHMVRLERYSSSDPHDITKLDELDFPRIEDELSWPFDATGEPLRYIIRGTQMDLYPIPDAVYTLRIYYAQRLTTLSQESDVSKIPEDFHDMIAIYAAKLARIKNQDDTSDLDLMYYERERDLIDTTTNRKGPDVLTCEGFMEGMY